MDDYIQETLAWFVIYESLPMIQHNVTNSGVVDNEFDLSQPATRTDFAYTRNDILGIAEQWLKEISTFIKDAQDDDSTKYPDYSPDGRNKSKYGLITYDIDNRPVNGMVSFEDRFRKGGGRC